MAKAVAIVSGGMDSVVLAHMYADAGWDLHTISFNYGQRHAKELQYARSAARRLGATHHEVDLTNITNLLQGSSLTTPDIAVPDGHYAAETMRITVVPNRNAMMLNIAAAYATSIDAALLGTAVHGGDHYIYPDCRPEFIKAVDTSITLGTLGHGNPRFRIDAPFVYKTKGDIVRMGHSLGVDFRLTWSCYKGGDEHCGSCGTCFERREAFAEADVYDPTIYLATPDYVDPRKS